MRNQFTPQLWWWCQDAPNVSVNRLCLRLHRFVKSIMLELGVNGLSEDRLRKANHLRYFQPEKLLHFRRAVVLNDRVVGEIREHLGTALLRQVMRRSEEHT